MKRNQDILHFTDYKLLQKILQEFNKINPTSKILLWGSDNTAKVHFLKQALKATRKNKNNPIRDYEFFTCNCSVPKTCEEIEKWCLTTSEKGKKPLAVIDFTLQPNSDNISEIEDCFAKLKCFVILLLPTADSLRYFKAFQFSGLSDEYLVNVFEKSAGYVPMDKSVIIRLLDISDRNVDFLTFLGCQVKVSFPSGLSQCEADAKLCELLDSISDGSAKSKKLSTFKNRDYSAVSKNIYGHLKELYKKSSRLNEYTASLILLACFEKGPIPHPVLKRLLNDNSLFTPTCKNSDSLLIELKKLGCLKVEKIAGKVYYYMPSIISIAILDTEFVSRNRVNNHKFLSTFADKILDILNDNTELDIPYMYESIYNFVRNYAGVIVSDNNSTRRNISGKVKEVSGAYAKLLILLRTAFWYYYDYHDLHLAREIKNLIFLPPNLSEEDFEILEKEMDVGIALLSSNCQRTTDELNAYSKLLNSDGIKFSVNIAKCLEKQNMLIYCSCCLLKVCGKLNFENEQKTLASILNSPILPETVDLDFYMAWLSFDISLLLFKCNPFSSPSLFDDSFRLSITEKMVAQLSAVNPKSDFPKQLNNLCKDKDINPPRIVLHMFTELKKRYDNSAFVSHDTGLLTIYALTNFNFLTNGFAQKQVDDFIKYVLQHSAVTYTEIPTQYSCELRDRPTKIASVLANRDNFFSTVSSEVQAILPNQKLKDDLSNE